MDEENFGGSRIYSERDSLVPQHHEFSPSQKYRKQLCLKQMKHMDIQFLYVMEHVQNTTLSVKHCPTEEMVPDFSTKLLEGLLFVKLCNFIKRAEYADPDCQTQRGMLDEDDGSWHLEADPEAENLEA